MVGTSSVATLFLWYAPLSWVQSISICKCYSDNFFQPSEYEIFRANAMAEKERTSQEKLDKVLAYTKRNLVLYLSETDLNRLCGYITEYYLSDTLPKVEQIKVDVQLKTIDIMHFGWNIGKAFGKSRLQTATFIKRVFAHTLRDSEIFTIERKMSHTESECRIKLDRKIA